jgi:hypothetical protein
VDKHRCLNCGDFNFDEFEKMNIVERDECLDCLMQELQDRQQKGAQSPSSFVFDFGKLSFSSVVSVNVVK